MRRARPVAWPREELAALDGDGHGAEFAGSRSSRKKEEDGDVDVAGVVLDVPGEEVQDRRRRPRRWQDHHALQAPCCPNQSPPTRPFSSLAVAAKGLGARWVALLAAMAEGRGARGTPSTTARHRHHLGHHLSRVPISTRYGGGQICGRKAVGDCLLGAGGSEASGKRDGG
ncbi:Os12g0569000 [Oryza sativa Japonica Group]|uniref:Os12g0569000 protein n=1 Tax=Oryza sativa subsp. japonica TaxID=39947 RepID=Q0IMH6_ORYSJ|nr:Os12g0569000 [Oryza sativa Japonica Group]|eukprot:NP_001067070.1 Os12g0569000 [Oryza sativa Japonica Group]